MHAILGNATKQRSKAKPTWNSLPLRLIVPSLSLAALRTAGLNGRSVYMFVSICSDSRYQRFIQYYIRY